MDKLKNFANMIAAASLFAVVAAFFAFYPPSNPASAQDNVWLGVSRTGAQLIEIAVPELMVSGDDREKMGSEAAKIIAFDLKATGYFKTHDDQSLMKTALDKDLRTPGGVAFDEWKTISSNFVVKGNLSSKPDGSLLMDTRVYDVQTKKMYYSVIYTASKGLFRQMVHKFSDDLLARLTGEQGIARTRMAFVSKSGGHKELFVMDYDGANPSQITSDKSLVLFPAWNPKRDLVLFTTYRFRNPDLFAMDIKTKARYPISRKIGLNSAGEWSPDGRRIAFSISKAGHSNIFICDAEGKNMTQLTKVSAISTSPTFSPDGSQIAFTSDRTGSPQIYVMSASGGNERRVTWNGGYNDEPEWSPKGDYIAYSSLTGPGFKIAVVNPSQPLDSRIITNGPGSDESPAWAPNGRALAFSSSRGGSRQIYIMGPDGSNITRVTNLDGGGFSPAWGPAPVIEKK